MKKFIRKLKDVRLSTWLWFGLVVLLFVSAIVGLSIFFHVNGWTWMVIFGNAWFWFFSILALLLIAVVAFLTFKSKIIK